MKGVPVRDLQEREPCGLVVWAGVYKAKVLKIDDRKRRDKNNIPINPLYFPFPGSCPITRASESRKVFTFKRVVERPGGLVECEGGEE